MKEVCPYCMDTKPVKIINLKEVIDVKGSSFTVVSKALECGECRTKFSTKMYPNNAVEEAFNEYRKKFNLLTPYQIKAFRKELKLTQQELSKLLGFGNITISRYESGALQEKSHDNSIRMAMTSAGMQVLVSQFQGGVSTRTLEKIKTWIMEKKYLETPIPKYSSKDQRTTAKRRDNTAVYQRAFV